MKAKAASIELILMEVELVEEMVKIGKIGKIGHQVRAGTR